MKLKASLAIFSLVFSGYVFSDVSEGIVVEGQSIPIGISLSDSRDTVEDVISSLPEFSLTNPECTTSCEYEAINSAGELLGTVTFRYNRSDAVRRIFWTFSEWETTVGLSLADLEFITEKSELQSFYPLASRAIVVNNRLGSVVTLSDSQSGISLQRRESADGALRIMGSIF